MASKENQEALEHIKNQICDDCGNRKTNSCDCMAYRCFPIIQKAIDDYEVYKKAYEIAYRLFNTANLNYGDEIEFIEYCFDEARKELQCEKN